MELSKAHVSEGGFERQAQKLLRVFRWIAHLHSGQDSTPCCAGECLQVGCRQVVQGIPSLVLLPEPASNCSIR